MESPSEVTAEEYLAMDAAAPPGVKYEYDGRRVWALAGASLDHNLRKTRLVVALDRQLDGCNVVSSDQRVRIRKDSTSTRMSSRTVTSPSSPTAIRPR